MVVAIHRKIFWELDTQVNVTCYCAKSIYYGAKLFQLNSRYNGIEGPSQTLYYCLKQEKIQNSTQSIIDMYVSLYPL